MVIHTDVMDVPYHLLMAIMILGARPEVTDIHINLYTGYFLQVVLFAIKTRSNIDTITHTHTHTSQNNDTEYIHIWYFFHSISQQSLCI